MLVPFFQLLSYRNVATSNIIKELLLILWIVTSIFFMCGSPAHLHRSVCKNPIFFVRVYFSRAVAYVAYTKKKPPQKVTPNPNPPPGEHEAALPLPAAALSRGQPSPAAQCPSPAARRACCCLWETRDAKERDRRNDDKKGDLVELDERRGITLIAPNEMMTVER